MGYANAIMIRLASWVDDISAQVAILLDGPNSPRVTKAIPPARKVTSNEIVHHGHE